MNEVWWGDCLELMKNIPDKSIDMILCDIGLAYQIVYGIICLWIPTL
jgi:hypothetical protein